MHNNQPIAETSGLGNDVDLCEANAALIVKAVNEHAALVGAVEDALRSVRGFPQLTGLVQRLEKALNH